MRKVLGIGFIVLAVIACNNPGKEEETQKDTLKNEISAPPTDTTTVPVDPAKTTVDTISALKM